MVFRSISHSTIIKASLRTMSGSGSQRPVPASAHVPEDAITDADNNNQVETGAGPGPERVNQSQEHPQVFFFKSVIKS